MLRLAGGWFMVEAMTRMAKNYIGCAACEASLDQPQLLRM
jgi:hypothetical protein